MATITNNLRPIQSPAPSAQAGYFSSEQLIRIKQVALGVLVFLVEVPITDWVMRKTVDLMVFFNFDLSDGHQIVQLWTVTEGFTLGLLNMTFKAAVFVYTIILGPILEEWLFRDLLHNNMRTWIKNPDSSCHKVVRVLLNGLIFGTVHLSPFRGWANAPIFLISFLLGTTFAALREVTGNTVASTTTHILHNGDAMLYFLTD